MLVCVEKQEYIANLFELFYHSHKFYKYISDQIID